jgi:outer membrane protein assembly factor BamA
LGIFLFIFENPFRTFNFILFTSSSMKMNRYIFLPGYLRFQVPLLVLFLWVVEPGVIGQGVGGGLGGSRGRIEGKVKFMPVPYLNYDRSLGFMFGGVPMVMFNPVKKDTLSPSSLVGGLGMYTTNKTWFGMGFGMFHFDRDNWRVMTVGGAGTVHFQFFLDFLSGLWIPYESDATVFMVRVERRIYQKIYGGVSFSLADIVTSLENLPVKDTTKLYGLGLNISLDRRENPYYPRIGHYSNINYHAFPEWVGNEEASQKIDIDHNHYFPVRGVHDVLAVRLFIGLGLGDLTFNQQYIVGSKDIRGYTQGAYRGNILLALQSEYRWNFHKRWGAVGFAGVATVFDAINKNDSGKLLPGAGAGLRFKVFPDTNFSVGIDVAKGIGDWGVSFQIGESF